METEIAEQQLRYFVTHLPAERHEQAGAEISAQQLPHAGEMLPGEGGEILPRGRETQRGGQLQQEAEVVVSVVPFQCIQGQDRALAPFEKPLLPAPLADSPVEDLAHKQGDGVLGRAGTQAHQRVFGRQAVDPPQVGLGIFHDLRVQDAQRLEERHPATFGHGGDETAPPPVGTEGVQDEGALPDLGGVQDDELGAVDHQYCAIRSLASAWRSASS